MRIDGRCKGFTLFEMILAMILGVVVISSAYLVYRNLQVEWRQYYTMHNSIIEVGLFKERVSQDIDDATFIRSETPNTLLFVSQTDTIRYSFDRRICRSTNVSQDTFNVNISHLRFGFVEGLHDAQIVESFLFKIEKPVVISQVQFLKRYSSAELVYIYQKLIPQYEY